jgi:hypothetical protein
MSIIIINGIECENMKDEKVYLHIRKEGTQFRIKKIKSGKYWTLYVGNEGDRKLMRYKSSKDINYLTMIVSNFLKEIEKQKNGTTNQRRSD